MGGPRHVCLGSCTGQNFIDRMLKDAKRSQELFELLHDLGYTGTKSTDARSRKRVRSWRDHIGRGLAMAGAHKKTKESLNGNI